MTQHLC